MSTFGKLWVLLERDQKRRAVFIVLLMIVGMLLEMLGIGLFIPVLAIITDPATSSRYLELVGLSAIDIPPDRLILYALAAMVGVSIVKALFIVFLVWQQARFSFSVEARLSRRLFSGYLRQAFPFHMQTNSALLVRNVTSGAGQFAGTISAGSMLLSESLVLVGIIALLMYAEPVGTLFVTLSLGLAGIGFYMITRTRTLRWGEARQYHEGQRLKHVNEGLGGIRDVKIFAREQQFEREYEVHNIAIARVGALQNLVVGLPRLWLEVLAILGMSILILSLLSQGRDLSTLIPAVGLFAAAAFRIMPSINKVLNGIQNLRYSLPVVDLLYEQRNIINAPEAPDGHLEEPMRLLRDVVVEDVSYSYTNAPNAVLKNVSLRLERGMSYGFFGASGEGKTTLINIILGLLEPTSGTVTADGEDIHSNAKRWQRNIGYVPQSVFLTDDTLARNIAFGLAESEIDHQAVQRAADAAQLTAFISSLPDAFRTMVGERGVRLSGGQAQRIGIARALYHDPDVLVFDEASSALDSQTEAALMNAITALSGRKTVLVIAHRLTTVANCDVLYRVVSGRVERASHQDILPSDIMSA